MDVFVQCDIVDRSRHGIHKVVKVYGEEVYIFLNISKRLHCENIFKAPLLILLIIKVDYYHLNALY